MNHLCLLFVLLLFACSNAQNQSDCLLPEQAPHEMEYGYHPYRDVESAVRCSRKTGKPILIMFTGWACLSSSEIPWEPLKNDSVRDLIDNNYLLTTLYVDEKKPLAVIDTTKKMRNGKVIKTVGQQNLSFQTEHFQSNTQPYYVIVDSKLNQLTLPLTLPTSLNSGAFIEFLENGISDNTSNDSQIFGSN